VCEWSRAKESVNVEGREQMLIRPPLALEPRLPDPETILRFASSAGQHTPRAISRPGRADYLVRPSHRGWIGDWARPELRPPSRRPC